MPEQSYTLRGDQLALVERVLVGVIYDHEKRPAAVRKDPPEDVLLADELLEAISAERVAAGQKYIEGSG